jgi:hypothetical protein
MQLHSKGVQNDPIQRRQTSCHKMADGPEIFRMAMNPRQSDFSDRRSQMAVLHRGRFDQGACDLPTDSDNRWGFSKSGRQKGPQFQIRWFCDGSALAPEPREARGNFVSR